MNFGEIVRVCDGVDWNNLSEQGAVAGSCEYGNEPSISLRDWEFLDELKKRFILNKVLAVTEL
jgi:hypothetical protein